MKRELKFRVWDGQQFLGIYSNDWVGSGIGNVGTADNSTLGMYVS